MRSWFWLLLSVAPLAHAEPSARIDIEYELRRNGTAIAEVHERLERSQNTYELTETWKGVGLYRLLGKATRVSRGTIAPDGLRPVEFLDERTGRPTARAWFDWKEGTMTSQYRGDRRTRKLPPNAQDRLSFLLALAFVPEGANPIRFSIADGKGGLSRHEYRVVGEEKLQIPAGDFDAVKVMREREGERSEIWLARQHGRLPLRVLVTEEDGTRYDQVATRITRR
jgi:hypothetical protein